MKKFLGLILVLVCFVTPAFAEPVSQEIIEQAKAQAGLFMDLKNALGLDWLDQYNAYLASPDSAPQPTWATSVVALINDNYLSSAFPTDFQIVPAGQEVTIRRTITDQGVKNVLPVYLPSVMISGNTVSLLVQRPAQWVAWEAGLNSKISKDGSDNPDVLPNASLEFGSGSKIEFVSNDGKLIGVDNLTYKGQELEDRFVNAAGDNMTGALTISGNKVWHAGNDGSGSGLDADLLDGKDSSYYRDADKLDGQHGSFYQNASNLNAGTVPVARLSGKYNISISGDADTVDGKHDSDFALSGHSHNYDDKYVNLTGDTMTGILTTPEYRIKGSDGDTYPRIQEGSNDAVRIRTDDGYVDIGPANTSWVHFYTDRPGFYFDKPVEAKTRLKVYGTNTYLTATEGRINNQIIWHAGNDGSGSGLDADLLDGKHASAFSLAHDHPYVKKAGDTMTGNLTLQGTSINIQRPETSGGYARGIMFYSKDGSTIEAGIGMLGSGNNPPQTLYMGFGTSPWNSSAGLTVTPTNITFKNNKVWHAGNDGSGSGLDADLLDGQQGSFYRNASNLNAGTVPTARLSGTYNVNISGRANVASNADYASNSNLLDGKDSTAFLEKPIRIPAGADLNTYTTPGMYYSPLNVDAQQIANTPVNYAFSLLVEKHAGIKQTFSEYFTNSSRTWTRNYYNGTWGPWYENNYVRKTGDTMTGKLTAPEYNINDSNTRIYEGGTNSVRLQTNYGYVDIGPRNASLAHFYTDMPAFYFSKPVEAVTHLKVYGTNTYFTSSAGYISGSKVWTQGNDGSGSGLDADLLDGKHASAFASSGHTHNYVSKSGDTMIGPLGVNFENGITSGIGSHNIKGTGSTNVVGKGFKINWDTDFGFVGLVDKGRDRKDMVFANEQTGDNFVFMSQGMEIMALKPASKTLEIDGNKVWHSGNDGSGSGLDADTLDGKHASELGGGSYNGIKVYSSPGTYTWTKNSGTKYVFVQVVGGGGGGEGLYTPGGNGGTSRFGSYCYATGGAGGGRSPYTAGSGFGGDINVTGLVSQRFVSYWKSESSISYSDIPGTSPFGGTIGRGGASAGRYGTYRTGGAGGGYAAKWIDVSKVSSVSITVGAGGSGGSSGVFYYQASPGTPGIVIVHEFK